MSAEFKTGSALVVLLKTCAEKKDLQGGVQVHADILNLDLRGKDPYVTSALINMYAKCGALDKSQQVLDELPVRDVVSWSTLMAGYVQQGQGKEALQCFNQMQQDGISPNAFTFSCILKACGSTGAVDIGTQIHDVIAQNTLLQENHVLGNALVDMYCNCGNLPKAQEVFDELPVRNVVSWSSLIAQYASHGKGDAALACFKQMHCEGLSPNAVTFMCVLKACGIMGATDMGGQIHKEIVNQGLLEDPVLGNVLVDMYAKCGAVTKAQEIFERLNVRDIVCWNALITQFCQYGQCEDAINCFERMRQEGGLPDAVTFVCILKAYGSTGGAASGYEVHNEIICKGLLENDIVLGTALVDMYVKLGDLEEAHQAHEKLQVRNVSSWNALISGYLLYSKGKESLECFGQMQQEGISPDAVTLICISKVCGIVGSSDKGKQIHTQIICQGLLGKDIALGNTLVDMYAKCGAIAEAREVLDSLPIRTLVSWNALITGYAQQGLGNEALRCVECMQCDHLSPDAATFTCVLNACGHSGLVDESQFFVANMGSMYDIQLSIEHHTCMIDLFGRTGHFDKAMALIKKISSSCDPPVWSALLTACRKWGNVKLGRWAFDYVVSIGETG